ncbi:hypothetical protein [Deinococcus ficus]|uniref:Uncharacterized protein n=1 Tax=Deinococcus ficus TaxID=317577 RepID=A0A221SYR9_9DEIO|nr:hypothetical protein [Deinococcus ficus]ASN81808.1 hypothetical protein DFI_13120 [Deinococcus ficus]
MKKALLSTALLLSACAPTYTGPKPAPNEVIVEISPNAALSNSTLAPEQMTGIRGFSLISVLMIFQSFDTGLPAGYERFSFPDGADSMTRIGEKDAPMHMRAHWRSVNAATGHTVEVLWDSQPIGGKLLKVRVTATTTDGNVNTGRIEDSLLRAFVNSKDLTLVARGR